MDASMATPKEMSHIIFIHILIAGPAQNHVRMRVVLFDWSRPPLPLPPPLPHPFTPNRDPLAESITSAGSASHSAVLFSRSVTHSVVSGPWVRRGQLVGVRVTAGKTRVGGSVSGAGS